MNENIKKGWSLRQVIKRDALTIQIHQFYDGLLNITKFRTTVLKGNDILFRFETKGVLFNKYVASAKGGRYCMDAVALKTAVQLGQTYCQAYLTPKRPIKKAAKK